MQGTGRIFCCTFNGVVTNAVFEGRNQFIQGKIVMKNSARFVGRMIAVLGCVILLAACGGGGSGSDGTGASNNGGENSGGEAVDSSSDESGLRTRCGVVSGRTLFNPIESRRGEQVQLVNVLDSNALVVSNGSDQILVKLQGVSGTTGFTNTAAAILFNEMAVEPLFLFRAGDNCTGEVIGGQSAILGSIVTSSGRSFTEEVIARKYAGVIESNGICGEEGLSTCFSGIAKSNEHHAYGASIPCSVMPAFVRYRPSDDDCGGNASVVVDNNQFGRVFSIQLRYPDGTDRIVQSCEVASCTPLKVQNYIRTGSITVGCFGAPGNSVSLDDINHTSIKREGDDSTPPRYCIPNPAIAIN